MSLMDVQNLDETIEEIRGFSLSSPYGSGKVLGQPLGVKSVGFVELVTNSGRVGLGETYAGVYAPELVRPIAKFLGPRVLGKKIADLDLVRELSSIPFIGRNGILRSVSSAIDIALWDLRGKALGLPVHGILAAESRHKIPTYASGGSAALTPMELEADIERAQIEGFEAYKMRIGFQEWSRDLVRIKTAKMALGNQSLMLDAIMGTLAPPWSTALAKERLLDIGQFSPRWLEEPVAPDNISGLVELKSMGVVPIAAGEAYSGAAELENLIERSAVDILQVDATHSGGISDSIQVLQRAKENSLDRALHVWGSAAALAANAHIAIAVGGEAVLEVPTVHLEISRHMWVSPPRFVDGWLTPPDSPGLGVNLTEELKEKYYERPGSGFAITAASG